MMELKHLVENGVSAANLQARLDSNALLGWKIIHVVWTGAAFTVVWQRTEFV